MKTPRSFQAQAVDAFSDAAHFCLNFACGLGKTFTAVLISKRKKLNTLIIAPNNLCEQWRDELIENGVDPDDIFIASRSEENADPVGYAKKFEDWLAR